MTYWHVQYVFTYMHGWLLDCERGIKYDVGTDS
jgi:hypothetical protein